MANNRRVVAAAPFWLGSAADGLTQGLRKLDWDICYVDVRDHFFGARSLAMRLLARAVQRMNIAAYNSAILESVATLEPCAFLAVKGSYLTPATLGDIRRRGVMTLLYYPDFHFEHTDIDQETFVLYDYIFTNNSFLVPFFQKQLDTERVALLHFGYSAHVHYPRLGHVPESDFVADCGYVGNYTSYKMRWLEAVVRKLPEVKLAIIGAGWRDHAKGTPLEASVAGYQLVGDSYVRFMQQVRINIAIHMGPKGSNDWRDLVSMRTFEIPACKGFMLHIDNDEVRALFEPGREIDVFATPDELCEKIGDYLSRPELRREMIERAYARCVPAYAYDARAEVIGRAIEGRSSGLAAGGPAARTRSRSGFRLRSRSTGLRR